MQHKYLIFAAIVTVFASSCTVIDKFPPKSSTTEPAVGVPDDAAPMGQLAAMHDTSKVDIAWVFQYYRLISTVPVKILKEEFERTKKEFSEDKTMWNEWQMAMLLSLPSAPFYDPERSSALFKELADTATDQGPLYNDVAYVMYSSVKELYLVRKKAEGVEEQLSESRSANKTLQDQLEALKAIEENLYHRNKVEVSPKP
jgi:hypothetical protein